MPKGKELSKLKKTFKMKKQLTQKKKKNLRKKKHSFGLKKKDKCKQFKGGSGTGAAQVLRKLTTNRKDVLKDVIQKYHIDTSNSNIKYLKHTKKCGLDDFRCSNDRVLFHCDGKEMNDNCILILMFQKPFLGLKEYSDSVPSDSVDLNDEGILTLDGIPLTYVNGFKFEKETVKVSYSCNKNYEIFLGIYGTNLETGQPKHLFISFHFDDDLIREFLNELGVEKLTYRYSYTSVDSRLIPDPLPRFPNNSVPHDYIDKVINVTETNEHTADPEDYWVKEFTSFFTQMMTEYNEKGDSEFFKDFTSDNISDKLKELQLRALYSNQKGREGGSRLFQVPPQDRFGLTVDDLEDFFRKNFTKDIVNNLKKKKK